MSGQHNALVDAFCNISGLHIFASKRRLTSRHVGTVEISLLVRLLATFLAVLSYFMRYMSISI